MHQEGVPPSTSKVMRNSSAFRRWRKKGIPMAAARPATALVREVDDRLQRRSRLQLWTARHARLDLLLDLSPQVADADLKRSVGQVLPSLIAGWVAWLIAAGS
jgi:hypothetical protein